MNAEFKLACVMAQQLHGHMIAIDDDLDKPLVMRVLATLVGAKDITPLSPDERDQALAFLRSLSKGMN